MTKRAHEDDHPSLSKRIKDEWDDPVFVLEAVKEDGLALYKARVHTPEILAAAVQQNGIAIRAVPDRYLRPYLFYLAVETYPDCLSLIRGGARDRQLLAKAVAKDGRAFFHAHPSEQDDALLFDAVSRTPSVILRLPEERLEEDLIVHAIRLEPAVFGELPEHMITERMCIVAIEGDWINYFNTYGFERHLSIRTAAVRANPNLVAHMDGAGDELYELAVRLRPGILRSPNLEHAYSICIRAHPISYFFIPPHHRSSDLRREALGLKDVRETYLLLALYMGRVLEGSLTRVSVLSGIVFPYI